MKKILKGSDPRKYFETHTRFHTDFFPLVQSGFDQGSQNKVVLVHIHKLSMYMIAYKAVF